MNFEHFALLFSQIYFAVAFRNDEKFLIFLGIFWGVLALCGALKAIN
jgi:hypothetical protein